MPRMTAKYRGLDGINLDQFPSELTLTHGKEGEREWWEWWGSKSRRADRLGIIIQRVNREHPFLIFFEQGERTRTLGLPLSKDEIKRRVVAKTFGAWDINKAIKALADLGIEAKL